MLIAVLTGEFAKIIEVLLWIILPLLAFSLMVTVLLHYGKKRTPRPKDEADDHPSLTGSFPENFCYKTPDGKLVYLDHTGLLRDLRNKLSYGHARFVALKEEYRKLESGNTGFIQNNHKINIMEPTQQPLELLPAASIEVSTNPGEENRLLKEKIAEQEYLKEMVQEKKAQIEFLQTQLEQRIKTGHQSEQRRDELLRENESLGRQLQLLETAVASGKEELQLVKAALTEKEGHIAEMQQANSSHNGQVIWLENSLSELKQQNELLNAAVGDRNDTIASLREELEQVKQKAAASEQKLGSNKELLSRLYRDFTAFISDDDTGASPVIALNPDYSKTSKTGWGESVVES